jgi:hypothetical protein
VFAGLDLDGAVAAGGGDEAFDAPGGDVLDPAGCGRGGEHDGQVRFDRLAGVVEIGRAARSVSDIRKDFSTCPLVQIEPASGMLTDSCGCRAVDAHQLETCVA